MNKLDEYWYWASMAISEPDLSNNKYYYDVESDKLFGLRDEGSNYTLFFRNLQTKFVYRNKIAFRKEISKLQMMDLSIIVLPKLEFEEKKSFLAQFAFNIRDEFATIKEELLVEIAVFSLNDEFGFKTNFKDKSPSLYFEYQVQKGLYLTEQVKMLFQPLGITENSLLIW